MSNVVAVKFTGMSRKKGICAYCGKASATVDHIPPKGLYSKPFPGDLLTVPSCLKCNTGAAKDDEYFRSVMAVRHDTYGRSDTTGAAERTMRALTRAEGGGLRKLLLGSVKEVPLVTPAGLYVGSTGSFDVNMKRVRRVIERIARGLYYHHKGERVSSEAHVRTYDVESVKDWSAPGYDRLLNAIRWAQQAPQHRSPRDVVNYRFRETDGDPSASVWLLIVYETVPFVVVTSSPRSAA